MKTALIVLEVMLIIVIPIYWRKAEQIKRDGGTAVKYWQYRQAAVLGPVMVVLIAVRLMFHYY